MLSNSKTFTKNARTTYRPSTHPKWSKWATDNKHENPNPGLKTQISIEVFPAPTFDELCAMQGAMQAEVRTADKDKNAFLDAINREVNRCKPKPVWMRRPNQSNEQVPPTSHARIDGAQVNELKGILKPETLRRTFISIPALMAQIQADIQEAIQAKATQKTQAEMDAEAEAELLQARRL